MAVFLLYFLYIEGLPVVWQKAMLVLLVMLLHVDAGAGRSLRQDGHDFTCEFVWYPQA